MTIIVNDKTNIINDFHHNIYTLHINIDVFYIFSLIIFQLYLIFARKRMCRFFDIEYNLVVVDDDLNILSGQWLSVFQKFCINGRLSCAVY